MVTAVVSNAPATQREKRSEANEIFFYLRSRRFPAVVRSPGASFGYDALDDRTPTNPVLMIFTEMGTVMHSCEGEMVCESINPKIPYFNAPIYLENKVRYDKPVNFDIIRSAGS